jgi:hypothetical protein
MKDQDAAGGFLIKVPRRVVYKLDTSGNETILYNFTGSADGGEPVAGVILDPAGRLYGTTPYWGADLGGVVFKLQPK